MLEYQKTDLSLKMSHKFYKKLCNHKILCVCVIEQRQYQPLNEVNQSLKSSSYSTCQKTLHSHNIITQDYSLKTSKLFLHLTHAK